MPIDIRRDQILQLADAAAKRHIERQETASHLGNIFKPEFDAAAWLAVCVAAGNTGEWSGALFNQGEPVNKTLGFGTVPRMYALISTDGSQILPNRHGAVPYYFIQTGAACIVYGLDDAGETVQAASQHALVQSKIKTSVLETEKLYTADNEMISAGVRGQPARCAGDRDDGRTMPALCRGRPATHRRGRWQSGAVCAAQPQLPARPASRAQAVRPHRGRAGCDAQSQGHRRRLHRPARQQRHRESGSAGRQAGEHRHQGWLAAIGRWHAAAVRPRVAGTVVTSRPTHRLVRSRLGD